jgi:hypothetical protein
MAMQAVRTDEMTKLLAAAAIAIAATTTSALAQQSYTANAMLGPCKRFADSGSASSPSEGMCVGSLYSIFSVSTYFPPSQSFCSPDNIHALQLARVAIKYMEDNPARLHEPFSSLAIEAFRKAWPCKR